MTHYLVERYRQMLGARGHALAKSCTILDFCCGNGEYVAAFVEAGYDAYGFEPYSGIAPETERFSTLGWTSPYQQINATDTLGTLPDVTTEWGAVRLPYPDATFDFVFSTEVMEHLSNHDAVLHELRRITKPGGAGIHSFPARYRLIEPHIHIPLGGIIKTRSWYHLWGHLGVGAPNYTNIPHLSRAVLIDLALWYARNSLNYLTPSQLRQLGQKHFHSSAFDPGLWKRRRTPSFLYTRTWHVIWILERPRLMEAQAPNPRYKAR